MIITIREISEHCTSLSKSFIHRVLAPIQTGTKVVGTGLSNTYNSNNIEYAIKKHLEYVEASKSNQRSLQIKNTKKKLKELRKAVNEVCKSNKS